MIYAFSFGLACFLAGIAGASMAPVYNIGPYMGEQPLLHAFVVVILGGLRSIPEHIKHALQKGASRAEILEVFQLASVLGLEGYALAAETLYSGDLDDDQRASRTP